MTYDDMLAEAGRIAAALRNGGYDDAAVNTEDVQPGDPIPIFYTAQDGESFVLELNTL